MALEQLGGSGITTKSDPTSQVPAPPFTMVARRRQCSHRSTVTPNKTCSADLYRYIKRRVGNSLKQAHCTRNMVPSRKQAAYKLSRTQGSLSCLKRVPGPLLKQDSSCSNQQHHSCVLYKEGRRYEVGPTLCPTVENLDLVYQKTSDSQSPTYSRPAQCGSRQAIQARSDNPKCLPLPEDFQTICSSLHQPQTDLFATRFNNKLPLFVYQIPDQMHSVCHRRIWTHMPSHQ